MRDPDTTIGSRSGRALHAVPEDETPALVDTALRPSDADQTPLRVPSAVRRSESAQGRLDIASGRDASAHARDLAARARDEAAEARDLALARLEEADRHGDGERAITGAEVLMRAAERRKSAARYRAEVAVHRAHAARAREAAARDREEAAADRLAAQADRAELARQLAIAETDELTGARARSAGLLELDRELDRARRTRAPLTVVYLDIVGLKAVNDSAGHSAGDDLLRRVISLTREQLRPYDLIIRLGGDEFLCALPGTTIEEARRRFESIATALAAQPRPAAIRTGFAALAPAETVEDLIARADHELTRLKLLTR